VQKKALKSKRSSSFGGSWGCSSSGSRLDTILLEGTHKAGLVRWRLETTVTEFGRSVDELQLNLLQCNTLGTCYQSLVKNKIKFINGKVLKEKSNIVLFKVSQSYH